MKAINIWVTNRCNLCCEYCYEGKYKNSKEISKGNTVLLIDYIKTIAEKNKYLAINFHGGEPLLCIEIIENICEGLGELRNKTFFSLTTNGTLINNYNIEIIKKYSINLSISMDGIETAHNISRKYPGGEGTFGDCLKGVMYAKERGVEFRCRMTITPQNYVYLYESVLFLAKLGIKNIVAMPDLYNKNWTDDMIQQIEKDIKKILRSQLGIDFAFFEKCVQHKGRCLGGIEEINIDPDLNIYPCACVVGNEEYCLGNIETQKFHMQVYQKLNDMCQNHIEECDGCLFYNYCMTSRCRLFNQVLTGNQNMPSEVVCAFENMIFRMRDILNHTNGGNKYEN